MFLYAFDVIEPWSLAPRLMSQQATTVPAESKGLMLLRIQWPNTRRGLRASILRSKQACNKQRSNQKQHTCTKKIDCVSQLTHSARSVLAPANSAPLTLSTLCTPTTAGGHSRCTVDAHVPQQDNPQPCIVMQPWAKLQVGWLVRYVVSSWLGG